MKRITSLFTIAFATLIVAACVQVPIENNTRANQLAISSVRDMPINYATGSAFSLSPKYVKETSLKAGETQTIYQLYTDVIISDLESNGFINTNMTQQAAFHVGFGIALSDDFSDEKINEKFGINPGLPEQSDLTKGSFLIYIEDVKTGKRVWRGIAQGFAYAELTLEQRKQRTKVVVASVMKQFYQTN